MVVKNREKNLTVKAKFEKNATVRVEIPQDNAIRRINLHCKIVTNAGATPAVGIKNGNILNAIKRMQVKLNGTDDIFDLDLRTYFDVLTYEYGTKPYLDAFAIPVATKSSNDEIEIPIDFALIRNQISDYSALLPAQLLDSVELLITWGDIGDIVTTANTATIASSTEIALSLIEVYETTSNLDALNDIMGSLTKVYEGVEQTSITQAYASYPADELPIQVRPVPARHLAHLMIALKNITDGNPALTTT